MFGTKKKLDELRKDCIEYENKTNAIIQKLQWQINNPPKYKIGQKVKGCGECVYIEVSELNWSNLFTKPKREYKYTFKNKNKTITVCE